MHDTAYQIGALAMHIYTDLQRAAVLEVGSHAVNGSLRANALPTTRYVGVDLEEGEGVDTVVELGKPLPFEADTFDLVMASSVFEHDPCFWTTFLEMCRVTKAGGYVYLNVPSNGIVHRYPMDNWRFYPDAGKALVQWAVSQDRPMTLVESFVANRQQDIWNDFVAVFRKGRLTRNLPKLFMYEQVPCSNVTTWKSSETLSETNATEDMLILAAAEERGVRAEQLLGEASQRTSALEEKNRVLEDRSSELERLAAQEAGARSSLEEATEQLRAQVSQRDEAIQQARAELMQLQTELDQHRTQNDELQSRVREMASENERAAHEFAAHQRQSSSEKDQLSEEIEHWKAVVRGKDQELEQLAGLDLDLRRERELNAAEREKSEWLRQVAEFLLSTQRKWPLLSDAARARRLQIFLRERGLFDSDAYASKNPDVAAAGFDPLRHYLVHGMNEDRSRGV